MADNYLENQYEQYRARKAAWEKAKKSGDRKSTRLNSSHASKSRMPSSA